jgi:transcriptional regulator with XRE-family HTH domain
MNDDRKVIPLRAPRKSKPLVVLLNSEATLKHIRDDILRYKVTYKELAEKAQLANSTVSNIAIGHTRFPRLETIIRLLSALGWTMQAVRDD